MAALSAHVRKIASNSIEKQVARPNTGRIIATMANTRTSLSTSAPDHSSRDRTICLRPHPSVGKFTNAMVVEHSIAALILAATPNPALTAGIYFGPEARGDRHGLPRHFQLRTCGYERIAVSMPAAIVFTAQASPDGHTQTVADDTEWGSMTLHDESPLVVPGRRTRQRRCGHFMSIVPILVSDGHHE